MGFKEQIQKYKLLHNNISIISYNNFAVHYIITENNRQLRMVAFADKQGNFSNESIQRITNTTIEIGEHFVIEDIMLHSPSRILILTSPITSQNTPISILNTLRDEIVTEFTSVSKQSNRYDYKLVMCKTKNKKVILVNNQGKTLDISTYSQFYYKQHLQLYLIRDKNNIYHIGYTDSNQPYTINIANKTDKEKIKECLIDPVGIKASYTRNKLDVLGNQAIFNNDLLITDSEFNNTQVIRHLD